MAEVHVDVASQARSAVRLAGDVVTVEVAENPTTGYRWAIARLDTAILELLGDELGLEPEPAPGAGGTRRFRVRVRGPGTGGLELELRRPWAPGAVHDRLVVRVA